MPARGALPYGCVPQSMYRGITFVTGPSRRRCRPSRRIVASAYLSPFWSRNTIRLPSGANEPAKACVVPPLKCVRNFACEPSRWIVTRFAERPPTARSASRVSTMSLPSGDQSCLLANTSQRNGVKRRTPEPSERIRNSALAVSDLPRTNVIHRPSGETLGSTVPLSLRLVSGRRSPPVRSIVQMFSVSALSSKWSKTMRWPSGVKAGSPSQPVCPVLRSVSPVPSAFTSATEQKSGPSPWPSENTILLPSGDQSGAASPRGTRDGPPATAVRPDREQRSGPLLIGPVLVDDEPVRAVRRRARWRADEHDDRESGHGHQSEKSAAELHSVTSGLGISRSVGGAAISAVSKTSQTCGGRLQKWETCLPDARWSS